VFSEADKAKLKKHLVPQNGSLNKYLFVAGFRRRGGLSIVQALFPHSKRENVHTVGCKKPKRACLPAPFPKEKMLNTLSQTGKHESSQLNSPKAIVNFLLGNTAHSSTTEQVQLFSCENFEMHSHQSPTFISKQNQDKLHPKEDLSSVPESSQRSHPDT
jgi:hypothetical protein